MKLISVITPCYNEEANVRELYTQVRQVFDSLPQYTYEHIFIDNASRDRTVAILREIAAEDKRVKVIVNARNFGQIRSPHHALLQTKGEAVIGLVADLQDPPQLIPTFLKLWEEGRQVVAGVKAHSEEPGMLRFLRTTYYRMLRKASDVELIEHFTGFGLYDRKVVETIRQLDDPYPYFRGLIADLGFDVAIVHFSQPRRRGGKSSNNFYRLFDFAMLGLVSYSKLPLRLATFAGFICAGLSFVIALLYLVYKLIYWDRFVLGTAPLVVGVFFLSSVQLIFLGVLGEYIGSIHTYVQKRPLVAEKERINF